MKKFLVVLFLIALLPFAVNAQDLRAQLDVVNAIAPHSNKTDVTSSAMLNDNYKATLIVVNPGLATYTADNKLDIIVTHCETENGTYTPVLPRDIWGEQEVDENGVVYTAKKKITAQEIHEILYVGRKNYIKIKCDYSGSISESPIVYVDLIQGGKIVQK